MHFSAQTLDRGPTGALCRAPHAIVIRYAGMAFDCSQLYVSDWPPSEINGTFPVVESPEHTATSGAAQLIRAEKGALTAGVSWHGSRVRARIACPCV